MERELDEDETEDIFSYGKCKMRKMEHTYVFEYEWKLPKFSEKAEESYNFESKRIFPFDPYGLQWFIDLYWPDPDDDSIEEEDKDKVALGVEVNAMPPYIDHFSGKATFQLVNSSAPQTLTKTTGWLRYDLSLLNSSQFVYDFINLDALLDTSAGFLVDDQLTITCQLTARFNHPLFGSNHLAVKQAELLYSKEYNDCVLVCRDGEFTACKFLLASQSPVFRAMFQGGTEEAKSSRVIIEDLSAVVVEELCRFAASGEAKYIPVEFVTELLTAAEKYDMQELKALCSRHLCNSMTVENVCSRLIFADHMNLDDVKQAALKYFKENGAKGLTTFDDHDELFKEKHKTLLVELFSIAFSK